jgi:peptide subunit release factor 1 (eRF1)
MVFKRPERDVIIEAIRKAFDERNTMGSQKELRQRVLKELRKMDSGLTVSGPRLRRLAITSGIAKVDITWRETDRRTARFHCPVCGSELRALKNETVFGGTVTLGFKCPECPFRSSLKRQEPTRYVFVKRH